MFMCSKCEYVQGWEAEDQPFICSHPDFGKKGVIAGRTFSNEAKTKGVCPKEKWIPELPPRSKFKVIILTRCVDCAWCRDGVMRDHACYHPDVIEIHRAGFKDWKSSKGRVGFIDFEETDPEKEIYAGCPLQDLRAHLAEVKEKEWPDVVYGELDPDPIIGARYVFKGTKVQVRGLDIDRVNNARVRYEICDTDHPDHGKAKYTSVKEFMENSERHGEVKFRDHGFGKIKGAGEEFKAGYAEFHEEGV